MSTGKVILNTYTLACLAALVFVPLILLHGYRAWWLDTFYALAACAFIGGVISRHRMVRRNRES